MSPDSQLTIASLFSCGGMMECGAIAAGYKPIWGVEFDPNKPKLSAAFADSYELNIGAHIIRQPVQEVDWLKLKPPDVLWASPPCTRVSAANAKAKESKLDVEIAEAVVRAIATLNPIAFCLENVRGYQKTRSLQLIRNCLYQMSYGISEDILNAADYSVPQSRLRLILRAVLGQFPPALPPPQRRIGWYSAIADLIPELPNSSFAPWQETRLPPLLRSTLIDPKNGHIKTGTPTNVSEELPAFTILNAARAMPRAFLVERIGARSDRPPIIRSEEEISWTIRATYGTDQNGNNRNDAINAWIEDGRVVSLTPRALARLQTLPDWYVLPKEIKHSGPLLGNGVPSKLSCLILSSLKPILIGASSMAKTKNKPTQDIISVAERQIAAEKFVQGDRVRHTKTGREGQLLGNCEELAIPTFWITWDENETQLKSIEQADPLDLELVQSDAKARQIFGELLEETAIDAAVAEAPQKPGLISPEVQDDEMMDQSFPSALVQTAAGVATPSIDFFRSNMNNFTSTTATVGRDESVVDDSETNLQAQGTLETETSDTDKEEGTKAQSPEESLAPDEIADRHRLELQVERSFYQAGSALRELRDRRLYRSSYKSFDNYCHQRFGYNRSYCHYLIKAADIVDNLKVSTNSGHFLPTRETQVRPLASLEPDEQPQAWQKAVELAGNKVPPARIVKQAVLRHKGVAEDLKKKKTPLPIPYSPEDVVMISGKGNPDLRKHDGRLAIVHHVNEYTVSVSLYKEKENVLVQPRFLEEVDSDCWKEVRDIYSRITKLQTCDLDPMDDAALEVLSRRTWFSERQKEALISLEKVYGIIK